MTTMTRSLRYESDNTRRRLRRDAARAVRAAERARRIAREVASIPGANQFQIPRCANLDCRAPLADSAGEPRWELLEGRFVCLGRCVRPGGEGGSRG